MENKVPLKLYKKMHKIVSEGINVAKNGYNEHHQYNFVTERDVLTALREKFIENNLFLKMTEDITEQLRENLTSVRVVFTIVDLDSGESDNFVMTGYGADKQDKGVYKAITGAKKYFFLNNFMIATGDDPENNSQLDKEENTSWVNRTNKTPVTSAQVEGEEVKLKASPEFGSSLGSRFKR